MTQHATTPADFFAGRGGTLPFGHVQTASPSIVVAEARKLLTRAEQFPNRTHTVRAAAVLTAALKQHADVGAVATAATRLHHHVAKAEYAARKYATARKSKKRLTLEQRVAKLEVIVAELQKRP